MSLYLDLLPLRLKDEMTTGRIYCYSRLEFHQDYRIFGQLTSLWRNDHRTDIPKKPAIRPRPVPEGAEVFTYEENGLHKRRNCPSGNTPLTYVTARQLKQLRIPRDASPWNKAIKAFVDTLPPNTPIILWWH